MSDFYEQASHLKVVFDKLKKQLQAQNEEIERLKTARCDPEAIIQTFTDQLIPIFAQMIDIFRNRSDAAIILFDLPPAFASDDAMISLELLDGYVLVVDSGKTTRKHVEDVLAVLHPTPCVGTILNRYSGGFADSYGYGYGGPDYGKYYDPS